MPKVETFDRDLILERVTNLFWVKGFNGTSMQDIVDVTGLNRSSIYNSFGDKRSLFDESMRFYKNQVQSRSTSNLEEYSPREAIGILFRSILLSVKGKEHTKGCFFTNCTAELATTDKEVHNFLNDNMADFVDLLEGILKDGVLQGEFVSDLDVHNTALFLFSSLQGIRVTAMIMDDEKEIESLIEATLKKI